MKLSLEYNMKAKNPLIRRRSLRNGFGKFGGEGFVEILTN